MQFGPLLVLPGPLVSPCKAGVGAVRSERPFSARELADAAPLLQAAVDGMAQHFAGQRVST